MPKITVTLQDAVDEKTGNPCCRVGFTLDRQGYALDAPSTPALRFAATMRILGDLGVIDRLSGLVDAKTQLDSLTDYLRTVGALDDDGNLHIVTPKPPMADNGNTTDLEIVEGSSITVAV